MTFNVRSVKYTDKKIQEGKEGVEYAAMKKHD